MSLAILAIGFVFLLIFSYLIYGRYVVSQVELDDTHITPAHRHRDDNDF